MSHNSRYYYKRYLQEAIDHLYICHQRIMSASTLIKDDKHIQHMNWLQEFDHELFKAMENLKEYEASM